MKDRVQAVFIDRDGTIGGTGHFIHPSHFSLYPEAQSAICRLKQKGIKLFAFTNQHRISRGEASIEEFSKQFLSYGFDQSYICPHEVTEDCLCHKPKPGMLLRAAQEYSLDLRKCVVIGDVGDTDMLAADSVGAIKILVKTGWGKASLEQYRQSWSSVEPDYIAEDLTDAVEWILNDLF
jgi:HAD superfamily hydrolase (TIGR01662 family)